MYQCGDVSFNPPFHVRGSGGDMTERWLNRRSVVQVSLKAGNLHAYRGLSAITLRASQFDSGKGG